MTDHPIQKRRCCDKDANHVEYATARGPGWCCKKCGRTWLDGSTPKEGNEE